MYAVLETDHGSIIVRSCWISNNKLYVENHGGIFINMGVYPLDLVHWILLPVGDSSAHRAIGGHPHTGVIISSAAVWFLLASLFSVASDQKGEKKGGGGLSSPELVCRALPTNKMQEGREEAGQRWQPRQPQLARHDDQEALLSCWAKQTNVGPPSVYLFWGGGGTSFAGGGGAGV